MYVCNCNWLVKTHGIYPASIETLSDLAMIFHNFWYRNCLCKKVLFQKSTTVGIFVEDYGLIWWIHISIASAPPVIGATSSIDSDTVGGSGVPPDGWGLLGIRRDMDLESSKTFIIIGCNYSSHRLSTRNPGFEFFGRWI